MGLFSLNKPDTSPVNIPPAKEIRNKDKSYGVEDKTSTEGKYMPTMTETIKRYRLQMLTSSYIYEVLAEDSFLSDSEWDERAKKLARLQEEHPRESSEAPYCEMFKDWTGDTASGLTYDEHIINSAKLILFYKNGGKSK
jgi:hypothetical protein